MRTQPHGSLILLGGLITTPGTACVLNPSGVLGVLLQTQVLEVPRRQFGHGRGHDGFPVAASRAVV
jgi:hypothetical protein